MRALAFFLFAGVTFAQQPEPPRSEPARLELRLTDPHVFQKRELIAIEIEGHGIARDPRAPEQWQFAGFLMDPPGECGAVEKPCYSRKGFIVGRPEVQLEYEPRVSRTALNVFMDTLAPGRYQVTALARKLVLTSQGPTGRMYGVANPAEYLRSNTVAFTVRASAPAWIAQTITRNVATLRTSPEYNDASREAARQLALLDTPEAWRAALGVLPIGEDTLLEELPQTGDPGGLCELMRSQVPASAQAVTNRYLDAMVVVCTRANLPQPPPDLPATAVARIGASTRPFPYAAIADPDPEREAYFARQRAYTEELLQQATSASVTSLEQKQPEARAASLGALIAYVRQLQFNRPPGAIPSWTPTLTREFVRILPTLESNQRRNLLSLYTSAFRTPEVAPILEAVLDEWQPGDNQEETREAVYALYKADPRRAKDRIRGELTKAQSWLEIPFLELLPANEVPPMDDQLIEALAAAQRPPGGNLLVKMAAIGKYATPQALPRIRALYESLQVKCQPELAAYFLRVDPAYGTSILQAANPTCAVSHFTRAAALGMHPALEAFIVPFLMQGQVFQKTEAAKALGEYGSAEALKSLWSTYRYFHEYWDGQAAELEKNGEGVALEVELRNAIARGTNWAVTDRDLHEIEQLCISERCKRETGQDLVYWREPPILIDASEDSRGIRGQVAHYNRIETIEELEAKLAQFPSGTQARINAHGPNSRALEERIRAVASRTGLIIVSQ